MLKHVFLLSLYWNSSLAWYMIILVCPSQKNAQTIMWHDNLMLYHKVNTPEVCTAQAPCVSFLSHLPPSLWQPHPFILITLCFLYYAATMDASLNNRNLFFCQFLKCRIIQYLLFYPLLAFSSTTFVRFLLHRYLLPYFVT